MTTAFVGFCYGGDYQQFLPLYTDTVLRSNPGSSVLLFADSELNQGAVRLLDRIRARHSADVRVRTSYTFGMGRRDFAKLGPQAKRSMRWLFYDDAFRDFDNVYLGDIDMLMLPEPLRIEQAHSAHAKMLGLPYSNYVRVQASGGRAPWRATLGHLKKRDVGGALRSIRNDPMTIIRRMTGLHFVDVQNYYPAVRPHFDRLKERISQPGAPPINDESLLYDLIKTSGLALPPISPSGPDLDPLNYSSVGFRPHHGIHLGIFRSSDPRISNAQVLESQVYQTYYKEYRALLEDSSFREITQRSGPLVSRQLGRLDRFLTASEQER